MFMHPIMSMFEIGGEVVCVICCALMESSSSELGVAGELVRLGVLGDV